MRRLLLLSLLLATAAAGPREGGRDGDRDGARAEAQRRELEAQGRTAAAVAEEQRLAVARVAAAARLHTVETEVAARADEVAALAARRDAAAARLASRAAALVPLLPLMQRLALFPAETLLAVPGSPEQTLRGLAVLRGVARQLEAEAAALRRDQVALEADADAVAAALSLLQATRAAQALEGRVLDGQLLQAQVQRQRAEAAGVEASRRAAAEAARADSLRGALAALEAARARAEVQARDDAARAERQRQDAAAGEARRRQDTMARPAGPAPEPRGQLLQPVAGTLMRGWGEQTDAGPASGLSYRPAPGARVVAPCGGRIRFAGPFRSYGALLILDCGGGYAFVLSGLGRLDVAAGGTVLPGEPLGVMPEWNAAGPAGAPSLYVELRRDGQALDPTPFLRRRP